MSRARHKKHRRKAEPPRRGRCASLRLAAAILVAVALVGSVLGGALLFRDLATGGGGPKAAAIVDQLSLTQPNPDFAASATSLLEQAGYRVDYYPGEQVTVDFYRSLPTHGYDLIILRVHSGITSEVDEATGQKTNREYVGVFTSEPYSDTKYPDDMRVRPGEPTARLGKSEYYEGAPPLFGIAPAFVQYGMKGKFDKALILLMGCDGLRAHTTAQAFLDKGAEAFVSWSKPVSASHTDAATLRLLQDLLVDGLTVGQAVAETMADVGPDPTYESSLLFYPPDGGDIGLR